MTGHAQPRSTGTSGVMPRVVGASLVTLAGGSVVAVGQPVAANGCSLVVNSTNDSGAGSLRYAINCANTTVGADTITITATGTSTLGSGLPDITESVVINGPQAGDPSEFIIDGVGSFSTLSGVGDISMEITDLYVVNASGDGISLTGTSSADGSVTLSDVEIRYSGDDGIDLYAVQNVSISDTNVTESSSDGLEMDSEADWSDSVEITNTSFTYNSGDGINGDDIQTLTLTYVSADYNGDYGVYIEGIGTATISNSTFFDNGDDGLKLEGFQDGESGYDSTPGVSVTLTDVYAAGNSEDGVDLYAFQTVTLSYTTTIDNGDEGIEFDSDRDWSDTVSISYTVSSNNEGENIDGDDVVSLIISNVEVVGSVDEEGMIVEGIEQVTITDSDFSGNYKEGIDLNNVAYSITIEDTIVSSNNDDGIDLEVAPITTISRVTAENNGIGLRLKGYDPSTRDVMDDVTVDVTDSSFLGNEIGGRLNGIADANLERVTIANSSYEGLSVRASEVSVTNSTITGNTYSGISLSTGTAPEPGTLTPGPLSSNLPYVGLGSTVTLFHSTVTGNGGNAIVADPYANAFEGYTFPAAHQIVVDHSVVSGNDATDIVNYSVDNDAPYQGSTSVTWSLVDDGSDLAGGSNVEADDPMLAALADNGGETLTMLPDAGSPVVSAGDPAFTSDGTDQRGSDRVVNRVEIGSVELDADQGRIEIDPPSSAGESDGIVVPVTRTGGSDGAVSVTLRSSCDGTEETVTWADGESGTKSVTFPLVDNSVDDADTVCTIELVDYSGGGDVGTVASWSVNITDPEDAVTPTLPATGGGNPAAPVTGFAGLLLAAGAVMSRLTRRRPA